MSPELEKLIYALGTISGINCVVQGEQAVAELFFNEPGEAKIGFLDGWGTIESAGFHIHFKSTDLADFRFVDEAGSCVERATYLTILDLEGKERLRFYFANPSDNSRPYTEPELGYFDQFRAAYQK